MKNSFQAPKWDNVHKYTENCRMRLNSLMFHISFFHGSNIENLCLLAAITTEGGGSYGT